MPKPKKARRFGGTPAHHQLILANLATELIRHGRIRTTAAKASNVQPVAERMITFAKRGDVHARRQVSRTIRDQDVVRKLFDDVGPAFAERDGGYTRVLRLGPRKGDNAPMVLIELTEGVSAAGEGELEEPPRRRWSLRRGRGGSQSSDARERAEERAAAVDRGEEPEPVVDHDHDHDHDHAPAPEAAAPAELDEAGPQVRPEDVEARAAAEEQAVQASADEGGEADAGDDEAGAEGDEAGAGDDDEERQ